MASPVSTPEAPAENDEHLVLGRFLQGVEIADYQQLSEDNHAQASLSSPPKKRKKLEATWKRRKDELHGLRAQVKEMQTMIAFLKVRNTHSQILEAHGWLSEDHRRWKATAIEERKLCQLAKLENIQVKEKTELYAKIIATLQTVLDAAHIERSEQFVVDAITERALRSELRIAPQLGILRLVVFNVLENAIQARCDALESILAESRAAMSPADMDRAQAIQKNGTTVLEIMRAQVLPYSTEKASTAFWDVVKKGIVPDERSARVALKPGDVVQVEGYFTQPLGHGGSVDIHAHCLLKRVKTSEGFLMVNESSTEWSARLPTSGHWKYQMRGSGWGTVYPVSCPNSGVSQVITAMQLQACHLEGSKLPLNVSNDIVACFRRMMRTRHQILDNFLLDSTRAVEN